MRIQIRQGVFETNSSSIHAICIAKELGYPKELPKELIFYRDEFGWENEEYRLVEKKASYLYEAILCIYSDPYIKLKEVEKILNKYGTKCEFKNPDKLFEGYIDHGSELRQFIEDLLSNEDKLMTYLFGDSFIITGNDNNYDFQDRMHDRLEDEKTMYGTFRRYSDTYKFEFNNYDIYEKRN